MIQASGVVDFHYKSSQTSTYKEHTIKNINKRKNRFSDKFEVISVSSPYDMDGDIHVRVSCLFTLNMPENFYCKTTDDYVGHVFPTLRERLLPKLISTKVNSLTKISGQSKKSN